MCHKTTTSVSPSMDSYSDSAAEPHQPAESRPERPKTGLLLITTSILTWAAFPPLDLGFLAWFSLAPLFVALERAHRPRRAFAIGYLFGILHWGAIIYWIGTTV